jgi:hypothetical protein
MLDVQASENCLMASLAVRDESALDPDLELADELAKCYADPLRFVLMAYPWNEPGGPLEHEPGPDDNQKEFLRALGVEVRSRGFDGINPVLPIQMAESSGHGTGKSAMGAWLADWILSTRPHSVGTITAGTAKQLEERTWAAVRYWTGLCITAHWFDVLAGGIYHKQFRTTWKVSCQTSKEENAQSFAGQHARTSTSWYLFDEASEVPDKVFETAAGGLTDGEPMFFVWGQLVRNTGMFYRICCGDQIARWNHRRVDSRTSRFTNKALISQWESDWGSESDYFKVRALGLPPSASELQYIDKGRVSLATERTVQCLHDDPLIAGFDVSGGGKAWNVIRFRRGLDGKPADLPPIRIPGEHDPERSQRVGICAELLRDRRTGHQLAAMFVDSAFGAPIVARLKALGFTNVHEVNFGGASPDQHQLNMRAYMWAKTKEWLLLGSLPKDTGLPESHRLSTQLCIPGYHTNNSGKLVLESKADIAARGEASPDDADAFCLTFAQAVNPVIQHEEVSHSQYGEHSWMA